MNHDDDETLEELGRALGYEPARTPPDDRVAAIRAAAGQMRTRPDDEGMAPVALLHRGSGRRLLLAGGIAAGVGGIAGYVVRDLSADEAVPPVAGAPVEPIAFVGEDAIQTEAGLINHTWGTELMLDVTGLAAGTTYDVVYRTSGGRVSAGSLLAVDGQLMKRRFNAATLRSDVRQIAVTDPAGDDVLLADLPAAGA